MENFEVIDTCKKYEYYEDIKKDYCKILDKDSISECETKLKNKYAEYIGKIIKSWKIENVITLLNGQYLIALFESRCIRCGTTKREEAYSFLCGTPGCNCGYEIEKEWMKIQDLGFYNSKQEYVEQKIKNFNKKYYLINPNAECKKENLLYGSVLDLHNYYEKNKNIKDTIFNCKIDSKTEIQCKSCGKILKKQKELYCCDNCGAYIYRNNDFRYNLITCNYQKMHELDLHMKRSYLPSSISYYDMNTNKYEYRTMDSIEPIYACINGKLERLGFSQIDKFNQKRIEGDFILYTNSEKYINYHSVYASFYDKSNGNKHKPIVLYKKNGKYTLIFDKYEVIEEKYLDEIKLIAMSEIREDVFRLNVYENDKLVAFFDNVKSIKELINNQSIIIEFWNNKTCLLDIYTNELSESKIQYRLPSYNFEDTFTNINIDLNSNLISEHAKQIIKENLENKTKYTDFKRIYVKKNYMKNNTVLLQYLEDLNTLKKMDNEFEEDKTENYFAEIQWDEKEKIEFIEYIESLDNTCKGINQYSYNIFDFSLTGIVNSLFSDLEVKTQIIELIQKEELLKVEDKTKLDNIIDKILRRSGNNQDIDIYDNIRTKLMNKYKANRLELLLILISKYGEEHVLELNKMKNMKIERTPFYHMYYLFEGVNNKKKFDEIVTDLNFPEIRWKSEYLMFQLVKSYFKDAVFQYKSDIFGKQSLDVYIPNIKLGFEYQGLQHYEAIDIFGGQKHFETQMKNDKKKKEICISNNIKLIEWKYNEPINKIVLDRKLKKYKTEIENIYKFTDIMEEKNDYF